MKVWVAHILRHFYTCASCYVSYVLTQFSAICASSPLQLLRHCFENITSAAVFTKILRLKFDLKFLVNTAAGLTISIFTYFVSKTRLNMNVNILSLTALNF